jgi:hypothetical protein
MSLQSGWISQRADERLPAIRPARLDERASGVIAPSERGSSERPRLLGDLAKVSQGQTFADDVEQIAMFAGRGVGPFPSGSLR